MLPNCRYDIENPQSLNFPLYTIKEITRSYVRGNAVVYVEALVVMSTRFLKDHIEIKWWTDGYSPQRVDSHSWHMHTKLVTVLPIVIDLE